MKIITHLDPRRMLCWFYISTNWDPFRYHGKILYVWWVNKW